jgi:uncharacterized Zn-binding protein involved in type VI secretion
MSYGIAVKGLDSAGGTQLAGGQSFFSVENALVVLLGDPVAGHGLPPHAAPVMAQGSGWMTLGGVPVCREGHAASCGHPSTGRGWFGIPD